MEMRGISLDLLDIVAAYVGPRAHLSLCADRALRAAHLRAFHGFSTCPFSGVLLLETARTLTSIREPTAPDAALRGCLDCLRYAHENGVRDTSTCVWAALGGHIECLRFAHENGYRWDGDA